MKSRRPTAGAVGGREAGAGCRGWGRSGREAAGGSPGEDRASCVPVQGSHGQAAAVPLLGLVGFAAGGLRTGLPTTTATAVSVKGKIIEVKILVSVTCSCCLAHFRCLCWSWSCLPVVRWSSGSPSRQGLSHHPAPASQHPQHQSPRTSAGQRVPPASSPTHKSDLHFQPIGFAHPLPLLCGGGGRGHSGGLHPGRPLLGPVGRGPATLGGRLVGAAYKTVYEACQHSHLSSVSLKVNRFLMIPSSDLSSLIRSNIDLWNCTIFLLH
jgi:hypothetical protein